MSDKRMNKENLRAAYAAIVDYHNSLVLSRFTVAGLVLTANGFLAVGFFQEGKKLPLPAIPILGFSLAIIFWIIEIRTYNLLENLGGRGIKLERLLKIDNKVGFFYLMDKQPKGPKFLILRFIKCNRPPGFIRYIFSHSFGLGLLYLALGLFWVYILRTSL